MKKILFISTGFGTGGAEMMLYKVLSRIDRSKFEPVALSLIKTDYFSGQIEDRISALDIPTHSLGLNPGEFNIGKLPQLLSFVLKEKPDMIQGWMYHANLAAQISSTLALQSTPNIWNVRHSLHSLDYEKKSAALVIRLLSKLSRFPAKIIYNSQTGAIQHEKLGYKSNKTIVIPNGFDTELFRPSQDNRQRLRQELEVAQDTILIGRICRYHPMKDHATLIRAAAILLKDFPNLHFVLAGTSVDQENPELTNLVEELGIGEHIHLLGERKDIPYLTSALDISTSSSYFGEAFPNVIGEAMSCEVPCVVTDIGDSALIVGDTGKVVSPKNPEAFANACRELLCLEPAARKALGQKARQKVIELYSLEAIVTQYETLYHDVIHSEEGN